MRIRQASSPFSYPGEVVRTMRPQIVNAMLTMRAHYARRHESAQRRQALRQWIAEVKRIDANSGYASALAQHRACQ